MKRIDVSWKSWIFTVLDFSVIFWESRGFRENREGEKKVMRDMDKRFLFKNIVKGDV